MSLEYLLLSSCTSWKLYFIDSKFDPKNISLDLSVWCMILAKYLILDVCVVTHFLDPSFKIQVHSLVLGSLRCCPKTEEVLGTVFLKRAS